MCLNTKFNSLTVCDLEDRSPDTDRQVCPCLDLGQGAKHVLPLSLSLVGSEKQTNSRRLFLALGSTEPRRAFCFPNMTKQVHRACNRLTVSDLEDMKSNEERQGCPAFFKRAELRGRELVQDPVGLEFRSHSCLQWGLQNTEKTQHLPLTAT
jgi:hypothetical protein